MYGDQSTSQNVGTKTKRVYILHLNNPEITTSVHKHCRETMGRAQAVSIQYVLDLYKLVKKLLLAQLYNPYLPIGALNILYQLPFNRYLDSNYILCLFFNNYNIFYLASFLLL